MRRFIISSLLSIALMPCLVGEAWSGELVDCRAIGDFVYDIDEHKCVAPKGGIGATDLMAPLLAFGNPLAPDQIGQNATVPEEIEDAKKKDDATATTNNKQDTAQCDSKSYMSGCADGSTYCTLIPGRRPPAQTEHLLYFLLFFGAVLYARQRSARQ